MLIGAGTSQTYLVPVLRSAYWCALFDMYTCALECAQRYSKMSAPLAIRPVASTPYVGVCWYGGSLISLTLTGDMGRLDMSQTGSAGVKGVRESEVGLSAVGSARLARCLQPKLCNLSRNDTSTILAPIWSYSVAHNAASILLSSISALGTLGLGGEGAGGVGEHGGDESGNSVQRATGDGTIAGGRVGSFSTGFGRTSISLTSTSFTTTTSGPGLIEGDPDQGEGGADGVGLGLNARTRTSGLPVIENGRDPLLPPLAFLPLEPKGFELDELMGLGADLGAVCLDEEEALVFDFGGA
jgi:hypothetical protein